MNSKGVQTLRRADGAGEAWAGHADVRPNSLCAADGYWRHRRLPDDADRIGAPGGARRLSTSPWSPQTHEGRTKRRGNQREHPSLEISLTGGSGRQIRKERRGFHAVKPARTGKDPQNAPPPGRRHPPSLGSRGSLLPHTGVAGSRESNI